MTTENMKFRSKQLIGFINSTLKGLRVAQDKGVTEQQARYIIDGVLFEDVDEEVYKEVSSYCKHWYNYKN